MKNLSILFLLISNFYFLNGQNLFVRGEYQKTKVENKVIAILPIIDSIWIPSKSWSLFSFRNKEAPPIDFKTVIYKYLPHEMSSVSNNQFLFIDVDYTKDIVPRPMTINRNVKYDTSSIYLPQTGQSLTALDSTIDLAVLLYGVGFQSTENKSTIPVSGVFGLTLSTFKGKMYAHCVIWDNRLNKFFAQGRINVDVKIGGEDFEEEDMKKMLNKFAIEFVKKTPLAISK